MDEAAKKITSLPRERSHRTLGTDELNICEFPLTTTGKASSKKENVLVFEDEVFDEGSQQFVHRKLMVTASEAYGLPTPADSDVLLVLMQLTNSRNGFTDRTVQFTRYDLVKCLGWDQGGKSYRRLEESLRRWVNITLNYNQAWWDRDCRRWQNKSFHILETVDLRGRGESADDGSSNFTWNQVIFDSFQANYVKRLDLETYFRLKSPTAKQAYRFLDKRFYRSKVLEFKLRTFACEHVGLGRNYDSGQLKRKLQPALNELEQIRFLKPMTSSERYVKRQRGEWFVKLIREWECSTEASTSMERDNSNSLACELTSRGIQARTAKALVGSFSEECIREKISLHDWLMKKRGQRCPKNPAGYLTSAIREDYRPPSDFYAGTVPKRQNVLKRQSPSSIVLDNSPEKTRLDEARKSFQALSPDEQARVEKLAVERGNRFRVDTYYRLREGGGKLWEEVRDLLLADLQEMVSAAEQSGAVTDSAE